MENSLVVLHLLGTKQETCFWSYHTQIGFERVTAADVCSSDLFIANLSVVSSKTSFLFFAEKV
jgi:hypothetical protein